MPIGTCDPASRGDAYNSVTLETPLPNFSGSVLIDCRYGWDGVSVRPDCNGPVSYLRTRNTGNVPAWALLPNKKKAPLWVKVDPGTDVVITAAGTLKNLGLEAYADVAGLGFQFTQPA